MPPAVVIERVSKLFPGVLALDRVSLEVPEGSIFGLLGPNGAGKTTLFSLAAGFLRPSGGSLRVLGVNVAEISRLRGRFAMLPQDAAFQIGIPVLDQLVLFGRLNGFKRAEAQKQAAMALAMVGLGEVAHRHGRALSHGMLKRVALCQSFMGDPEVIFLDEPTAGLDPEKAHWVRELIRSKKSQKTIVMSSHNLQEVQELCDHVAILNQGRITLAASLEDLLEGASRLEVGLFSPLSPEVRKEILNLPGVARLDAGAGNTFSLHLQKLTDSEREALVKHLHQLLLARDLPVAHLREGATLEERFLTITRAQPDLQVPGQT